MMMASFPSFGTTMMMIVMAFTATATTSSTTTSTSYSLPSFSKKYHYWSLSVRSLDKNIIVIVATTMIIMLCRLLQLLPRRLSSSSTSSSFSLSSYQWKRFISPWHLWLRCFYFQLLSLILTINTMHGFRVVHKNLINSCATKQVEVTCTSHCISTVYSNLSVPILLVKTLR